MVNNLEYFNIKLTFDKNNVKTLIKNSFLESKKEKIFFIDGNSLATSNQDPTFLQVLNHSSLNVCDGYSIAFFTNLIHRTKYSTYTGPDFFSNFVEFSGKHLFLGNSSDVQILVKNKLNSDDRFKGFYFFLELPFLDVYSFNFSEIADEINEISPDFIWVSLGAPKQEIFIDNLFPFLNKGIMVGVGAAFNFFVGDVGNKRAPLFVQKLKLEWLYRSLLQPKRIGVRALNYLRVLPRLIYKELIKVYFK